MSDIAFRPYRYADFEACVSIFDANCPEFFAPNERRDYLAFLQDQDEGYEVCEMNGQVAGAFGLRNIGRGAAQLNWILLDPVVHGGGLGSRIMERVIRAGRAAGADSIKIAASHKSAPFFKRCGARTISVTEHGWGRDMHRVEMELRL